MEWTAPYSARFQSHRSGLHARLWMLWATLVSILVTVWLCTLGPLPAILAVVVEKHVLVAILIMRLDVEKTDAPAAEP